MAARDERHPAGTPVGGRGDYERRVTRAETQLDGAIEEIRKLRDRLHDVAEKIAPIVLAFDPNEVTTTAVTLKNHMESCERRGARLEKVTWLVAATMLAVLGVLLKAVLHL